MQCVDWRGVASHLSIELKQLTGYSVLATPTLSTEVFILPSCPPKWAVPPASGILRYTRVWVAGTVHLVYEKIRNLLTKINRVRG